MNYSGKINGMTWHAENGYGYWIVKLCSNQDHYSFTFHPGDTEAEGRSAFCFKSFRCPISLLRDICRGKQHMEELERYE